MASSSRTEASPLLGKRKSSPARQKRYASSSSSQYQYRGPQQTLDGEEVQSFISINIDETPTYGALIGSHILALLPGLALQLATILVVFHAPCHIDYDSDDRRSDRKICCQLLSDWMSMTAFTLGLISWLATYSLRPAIALMVDAGLDVFRKIRLLGRSEDEILSSQDLLPSQESARATLPILITIAIQTIALEFLRMFGVIVANAVLFANLARLEKRGKIGGHPVPQDSQWVLQWHDPRLTIGLWVAIGWCTTEFVVSAYQMLNRLTLYKPFYETAEPEMEEEVTEERVHLADSYTPPRSSLTGSQSPGANLSDSAATVRAPMKATDGQQQANGNGIESEEDKTGRLSPRARLLETKRQSASGGQTSTQYGESGFSIMRLREEAANEEEIAALRVQLDEEVDALLATRLREEIHQTLGQPLTEVPIVLCALWRVDGWMWNLTATLLMSASVTLAQGPLFEANARIVPPFHLVKTTLFILIALHAIFSSMWALLMPIFGFAFVTYTSLLAGLGLFITALARWGLLI